MRHHIQVLGDLAVIRLNLTTGGEEPRPVGSGCERVLVGL
ncbi:Uncharacterised protein [Mycobacteroides abscessus subsp. abscessus]|nr:Uncharacterised protein [Mycobacteroides abscessus subsp. abscessus]